MDGLEVVLFAGIAFAAVGGDRLLKDGEGGEVESGELEVNRGGEEGEEGHAGEAEEETFVAEMGEEALNTTLPVNGGSDIPASFRVAAGDDWGEEGGSR